MSIKTTSHFVPTEILIKELQQSGELPQGYRPVEKNQNMIDYLNGQIEMVKSQIEKFSRLEKVDYVEGLENSIPKLHAQIVYWTGQTAWKYTGYSE